MSSHISAADLKFCVDIVNALLAQCGISHTIASISQCSPSLFVLLFEGLFHFRLPNIHRSKKQTAAEKLHNMRELIATMEWTVGFSLGHIDAQGILDGEPKHLCLLIQIFKELCNIQATQRRQELELRRPNTPLPHAHEPEDYEENVPSQADEVSQWCDRVLRESNLTEHVREVVSLNPDYRMSPSMSPMTAPVQLLSLSAQQQRRRGPKPMPPHDGGLESTESELIDEEGQHSEGPRPLLHPRPLAALPLYPPPLAIAALRQPHLSPHAFLPMPKPGPEVKAAPVGPKPAVALEAPAEEQYPSSPPAVETSPVVPPPPQLVLPSRIHYTFAPPLTPGQLPLTLAQIDALLQESQGRPFSDLPPSLDSRAPLPQPALTPPAPPAVPLEPSPGPFIPSAPPLAPGPIPLGPQEEPAPPQPQEPPKAALPPESKARHPRQVSPTISQRPLGRKAERPFKEAAPPSQALKRRIVGDEKREMLRARRMFEVQRQKIYATATAQQGTEHAALMQAFRLLLKRERLRISEERGRLKDHQKEAGRERLQQQEALEHYFLTQHQMLTEEFQRVAECRRLQEKQHKQALEKLRREAREQQSASLEQYYQNLRSRDDARFHRSSLETLLKAIACSAG